MPQKSEEDVDAGEYDDMYFICFSSTMSAKREEGAKGATGSATGGAKGKRYSFSHRGLTLSAGNSGITMGVGGIGGTIDKQFPMASNERSPIKYSF
jgi:hypothetical protein